MILIKFVIAIIFTFFAGACVFRLFMKDKSVSGLLFIATSFFIGMSAISFQMQLYSLVGIQFSALKLGLPWLIFLPLFLKEKYLFKVKINLRKVDSPLLLF